MRIRVDRLYDQRLDRAAVGEVLTEARSPGLEFVVREPRGGKRRASWVFRYRSPIKLKADGSPMQRAVLLGEYPAMSLQAARAEATEWRVQIRKKRDPHLDREREAEAERARLAQEAAAERARSLTLRAAVKQGLIGHLRNRTKRVKDPERFLNYVGYALDTPVRHKPNTPPAPLGDLSLFDVTREHMVEAVRTLRERGVPNPRRCVRRPGPRNSFANRCGDAIAAVFVWAASD